ncbi:hypothetical protein DFS34DRAFT_583878, partial [Phlyctochytrium arcticum]
METLAAGNSGNTGVTTGKSASSPPLLELVHISHRLVLDGVYLNGLHALRRFELRNVSSGVITVKLRSTLGAQIAFQLTNENLPDHDGDGNDPRVTTNTVAAAAIGVFGSSEQNTLHGHQFNQLFNYVNHIHEITIQPGESQKIILAFLPDTPGKSRRENGEGEAKIKVDGVANDDEKYDFFDINGLLFFFAYKGDDDFTTMTTPTNNSSTIVTSTQSSPDQEISLKFRSRVCRSVLWTDISDTGILFDDCVVGGTYSQDFTVWNRSEIDLYWIMNMVDLSNRQDNTWLKLSDYETGEPLDGSKPISSYSHQRIRLTFRPREVGEFKYDLQLENANDAGNTVSATIDAIVRAAAREECLVVSSGNVLDFGDCVTGQWAKQRIVLRNVSEMPLEIGFASEIAGVVFQREDVVHEASTVVEPDAEGIVTLEGNSGTSETTGDKLMERLRALSTTSLGQHHQLSQQQHTRHGSSDTSFVTSSAVSSRPPSPPLIAKLDSEMDQSLLLNQTKTMAIVPFMTDGLETSPPGVTMIPVLSEGVGTNGEEYRRIEEMILRPGNERIVEVCYRPERDPWTADYRGGRLSRRNFRITLSYSAYRARNKEKKNIQCKARTCTSFIEVNPPLINFGDTDVGTLKALPITITNMSDLAAYVELRFVSKVLNASRDPLQILPKSSMELKIEIYPRKVNPDYRKQITVVNLLNRGDNSKTVEVRSTNIDKNRVTFHSLFYRILTPTSTNFIDFGAAIINAVVVRSFTIANISKKRLVLEVETSAPDEICTYIKRKLPELDDGSKPPTVAASMASVMSSGGGVANMTSNRSSSSTHTTTPVTTTTAAAAVQRRERLLEFISDHRKLQRPEGSSTSGTTPTVTSTKVPVANNGPNNLKLLRAFGDLPDAGTSADYLDLASSVSIAKNDGRKSPRRRQHTQHFLPGTLKQLRTQFRERNKSLMNLEDLFSATSGATPTTGGLASGATPVGSSMDPASLSLDHLIQMAESATGKYPPAIPRLASEEAYVKSRLQLNRELEAAISDGRLEPVSVVDIAPDEDVLVVVIFKPKGVNKANIQTTPKKQDGRIFLKLVEFDKQIQQPQFEQLLQGDQNLIPVRELLLRSSLCRSIMDLNQKNINFGSLNKNEHRMKSIVIRNKSEAPLVYAIRKSGSIASGDIILGDGRMGVVRGFGKREVEFMFDPSLAGAFHERLTIENVMDRENDQVLSVKAQIRKPAPFTIESHSVDFGIGKVGTALPRTQYVVISNTSFKKSRTFEVRVDPEELRFGHCIGHVEFTLVEHDEERPTMMLSKETEEEIEHLEQKLKIAKRKGRNEKVKKLMEKLDNLRHGIVDDRYVEKEDKVKDKDTKDETEKESQSRPSSAGPTSKMAPKVKRTETSIVFTADPRTIRTVAVVFRTTERPAHASTSPSSSACPSTETCLGSVYVHEHRNTDIIKEVSFKATVCYTSSAYHQALEADLHHGHTSSSRRHEINAAHNEDGLAATDTESQRPPSPLPTLLSIDQPIIDIGNIKVNERKDCYFTLVNRNATALSYTVIPNPDDSDLQFSQGALVGTLDAKETRRVDFAIQPTTSGRSKRVIQIQNHSTQQDDLMVTFNFYALSPNYLAFPALPDPLAGSGELDLGVCYLDANKKYARIVPYQVQNVSSEDLYLAAVSNLTQQCYIFADQASETPVVDLLLKCGQQVTVYIALQPYLGGASGGSGEEECRTLVGGIKFSVSNREEVENGKESLYHLTSYTTRFSALIGQSLLGVSSSVVDLGCAYEPGQLVTGSFEVHNVSRRLPGEFVVSCRSTEIEVDAYSGRLDGKRDGGTGDSATTSADSAGNAPTEPVLQETINFKIRCPPYGLLSEMIEIVNTHNSAQKLLVQVRHFVDRGTLKLELNNSSECETPREISTRTFPQLSWEDVYVELTRGSGSGAAAGSDESSAMVTLAKSVRDDAVPNYDQEVLVRNLKPEAVSIILSSDLNLTVKVLAAGNLLVDTAPIALCNDSEQPRASAPTITIAGLDTIRLVISVPTPASLARSDESLTSLNSGRKCSIPGICTMADSVSGTILAALDLLAWYGISRGTIEPQTLDLGKVGHFNRWNDVKFKLTLRNPVEIPLICEIILPDAVELASAAADRKPLHRVEANSSISLDATLKPRLLDQVTPGPRSVKIIGTNVYNPANAPSCSVTCQLTLFELKFERLVEGELVLPPLTHPHLPSTLPCDTWFAIVNTSEEEAKFETGCVLAPEIADYVRLDILSRFSNSPLVGSVTLAPRGSIEVRVRAYAREDSRLPPDSSALTAPEGVIFGTLCITSKQQEPPPDVEMEVTKMTENISIRGVLQEGQTFTVSHKRIELRSLLASDTEDEETDIVTPGPAIPVQRESVDIVNLSTTFPLDFKVFFEFPVDLPDAARILGVSPVDEEFCGHVDAGGKLSLDFELIDPR